MIVLVGRADDQAHLRRATETSPLVTITGVAGVGKTMLARQWADECDAAWIDLAPCRIQADVDDALASVDRSRHTVLDNCEHVVSAIIPQLQQWLSHPTERSLVCTSRAALDLESEHVVRLSPLAPEPALKLFRARLKARGLIELPHDLLLTISEELDGIPLAIDLAAWQARSLPLTDLLKRLRRGRELISPQVGVPERQRSLQTALRWSWDLLNPIEQSVLAQTSVFRTAWTAEMSEAIIDPGSDDVTRVCDELVRHSLVQPTEHGYRLMRVVRTFAGQRLSEMSAHQEALVRHATWFTQADRALHPRHWAEWSAVVQRSMASDTPASRRLRLLGLTHQTHASHLYGRDTAPVAALQTALLGPGDASAKEVGKAWWALGAALKDRGRTREAVTAYTESLTLADEHDPPWRVTARTITLAFVLAADDRIEEALSRMTQAVLLPIERVRTEVWAKLVYAFMLCWNGQDDNASDVLDNLSQIDDVPQHLCAYWQLRALLHDDHNSSVALWRTAVASSSFPMERAQCTGNLAARLIADGSAEDRAQGLSLLHDVHPTFSAGGFRADAHTTRALIELAQIASGAQITWNVSLDITRHSPIERRTQRLCHLLALQLNHALPLSSALTFMAQEGPRVDPSMRPLVRWLKREVQRRQDQVGLQVCADHTWFVSRGHAPIDLTRRHTARRIFAALVHARLSSPGTTIDADRLFNAGWPGENATATSARNRVRVTIAFLRSRGLTDVLQTVDRDYRLNPDVPLRLVTKSSARGHR